MNPIRPKPFIPSFGWVGSMLTVHLTIGVYTTSQAAVPAEDVDALRRQFQRLQEENSGLKQQLESQSEAIKTLMHRLEALERKAPEAEMPEMPELDAGLEQGAKMPSLNLRFFGDVNFREGGKVRDGKDADSTFSLGQLGLIASSELSERVSVMSEVVFHYHEDNSSSTTIERLQFQYHANDLLNARLGRTHTPFGYWNETFHHGTWFQTTALRPEIFRFHDGGSVVPIHSVGIELYGYQPTELVDLHYNVGVANGRGREYRDTVNIQDLNDDKALYGVLSFSPAAAPGLRFGVNAYGDVIPKDPDVASRDGEIDELITGAHLVYLWGNLEFLSEAMHVEHDDEVSSDHFTTWGLYAQVGYQWNQLKPYYRFDYLDVNGPDPFYGPLVVDLKRHTVGVRWDFITWAGLKFEYHYIDQDELDSAHAFYSQATFTY